MLEALLTSGNKRLYIPDSGPGSKFIEAGDLELGFFGIVSTAELFTASELIALTKMTDVGIIRSGEPSWLKFMYHGKVLFIPTLPLVTDISWAILYQRGLIYGTDDYGLYQEPPSFYKNQITLVNKDTSRFKVRLMSGTVSDANYNVGGEWNDLMYRVNLQDPTGTNWLSISNANLGIGGTLAGRATLIKERSLTSVPYYRGTSNVSSIANGSSATYSNSSYGWRPVLEYIPKNAAPFSHIELGYVFVSDQLTEPHGVIHVLNDNVDALQQHTTLEYSYEGMTYPSGISSIEAIPAHNTLYYSYVGILAADTLNHEILIQ